jgi:hypothetical protein
MKKYSLLVLSLFIASTAYSATVRTVDNNVGSVAMYSSITAAYADAEDGDTILVAGSPTAYGILDCYKELHFVGAGYWLNVNGIPGTNISTTSLNILFKENVGLGLGDSSGSSVTGIHGRFESQASVTGLVIDKCINITSHHWVFSGPVTITRSYHRNTRIYLQARGSSISNSKADHLHLEIEDTSVNHCVITISLATVVNTSVSNSIFIFESASNLSALGNFTYCLNVGPADIVPVGIGNNTNQNFLGNVIANPLADPAIDNYYVLKDGSPASGTGQNGADMGMFGGSKPYVLSGVPGIPRMTHFSVPAIATGLSALEFELSAQAFSE